MIGHAPARPGSTLLRATLAALLLGAVAAPGLAAQEDNPLLRWRFFMEQRSSPGTSDVPLGARLQQALRAVEARPVATRAPGAAGAIGAPPWTPIGPERIPFSLDATGRTSALALDPRDPDVLYIGGAQGGVWKTVDGGASWTALTDDQCSLAMGSIALDPESPDIVYAGTGEQHFSADSYYGCGVLRSLDGGATWTRLGESAFTNPGGGGARISRVVVDPVTAGSPTSTTVYVASDFGFWISTDSGVTWTRTLDETATDLALDPADPSILHVATFGGVFRSNDGGLTWQAFSLPVAETRIGRVNLAVAPSDGSILYASVHDRSNGELLGIFRSADRAETWQQTTAQSPTCNSQCWYDMALAVDPVNPNRVYFGGVPLYRSDDGGDSFVRIMGTGGSIHVDQHLIVVDPRSPSTVYVVNDGGVYRSDDRGETWQSLNTDLALTQFYAGVSIHPSDPQDALGGTQDNGTVGYIGSATWPRVLGADGGFTAIDPIDPGVRYAETQWGGSFSGPRRSVNGSSFRLEIEGIDQDDDAIFIPPLVMDPLDPTVLYFGTERLYRTTNRAESWSAISPSFSPAELTAIAPARADGDVVYIATNRGDVHVTRDGGESWEDVSEGLPNRYFRDLAVHPDDPGTVWLVLSGFGSGHVYRSDDFGETWTNLSGDLPDMPVNAILLDPADPEQVLIGTDLGVFVSQGGGTWQRFDEGMPNVAVLDLVAQPNAGILLAATHGRGMFSLPVQAPVEVALRRTEVDDTLFQVDDARSDSLRVGVFGSGWTETSWSASHGGAPWLTLDRASGDPRSHLAWTIDPGGLEPGSYEETIVIDAPGAVNAPFSLPVSFTVKASPLVGSVEEENRPRGTIVGVDETLPGSAAFALGGLGADTASWSVTHTGADWLEIQTSAGSGPASIEWIRDPTGLPAGSYVDTIRVVIDSDPTNVTELVERLVVEDPLSPEEAAEGLTVNFINLSPVQRETLDRHGNQDGTFNLGDVLAWIERCAGGGASCGSPPGGGGP